MTMFDLLGVEIKVGDRVVYGKSSRYNPIGVGVVQEITDRDIVVLGDGNTRPGKIPFFNAKSRMVVINNS